MKGKISLKIITFVLIALIFCISAVFAYSYIASDVGFTPKAANWNVDNVSDALDDLYFNTSDYKDFDLKIEELNGTYVIAEVPSSHRNNSYTYTWYLNNIPVDVGTNYTYAYTGLDIDTSYRIRVVISNGSKTYYSYEFIHTLDRELLYKEGKEYTFLTGGWNGEIVDEGCTPKRGLYQKTDKYMLLYYERNGCSMSRFVTTKKINSGDFNYINVKYYKTPELGSLTMLVVNGVQSTNLASDWLIDKFAFSNKNQTVIIYNWDSYDYIFEVYLSK